MSALKPSNRLLKTRLSAFQELRSNRGHSLAASQRNLPISAPPAGAIARSLPLRKTCAVRPDFEKRFRCIGSSCEDTCCRGWKVDIDPDTYLKYITLPAGPLRARIHQHILTADQILPSGRRVDGLAPPSSQRHLNPDSTCCAPAVVDHLPVPVSANIRLTADARCPFLDQSQLCQIQLELGESFLSHTCSTFPRSYFTIDNFKEKTLSLSCPEAARLVLLAPRLTMDEPAYQIEWDDSPDARFPLQYFFWPIREFSLSLIRNRAYPLWQRMFLLALFANRLDALARGQLNRGFARLLDDFVRAIQMGSLRNEMEQIPPSPMLQLEMVLRLINLGIRPSFRSDRFNECLRAFAHGIGHLPGVPIESKVANYTRAFVDVYEPFFACHPEILENYLAHEIAHVLFPFGQSLLNPTMEPRPAKAFALLAIQFAILKGLLIGSAAFHRENFSTAHVIQIAQTAYKHFEHDHDFLVEAQAALTARGLDNIPGLAALIRN